MTVADICLLLEGTYPFVRGGVSSWVHTLIKANPDLTFSLVFLGGSRKDYPKQQYDMPENVVHLETHFLSESFSSGKPKLRKGNRRRFKDSKKFHDAVQSSDMETMRKILPRLFSSLGKPGGVTRDDFLFSEAAWDQIRDTYYDRCTDPSFVDYFWTVRIMHAPIFMLADIASKAPKAHVYHSVSTGYAGLLGVMLRHARKKPMVLSEHGIYTKERKIDLSQAEWIKDAQETFGAGVSDDVGYIRRLWIRFFETVGVLTYEAADPIVALFEGNRKRQIDDGAETHRTQVIPNGIDLRRFEPLRKQRAAETPQVMALVGRVVPIKDVKTFIRSMVTVTNRLPDAEGWIVGPTEESPAYYDECVQLVESLGLSDRVKFLGFQKVTDIYPKIGLLVLSSISEALPLVILEGYAAGVPAVATNVGACEELIIGRDEEDKALGPSGAVVPIADARALGEAALTFLADNLRWKRAQTSAQKRVRRYYDEDDMIARYRDIYASALGRPLEPKDKEDPRGGDRIRAA